MLRYRASTIGSTVRLFSPLFLVALALALAACADGGVASSRPAALLQPSEMAEGHIIDTATGRSVPIDQVLERLRQQEVLYLGEEHHNRFHVEYALSILKQLISESRRPILAMEMFGWDGQALMDRYVRSDGLSREDFVDQVNWKQIWGGPFADYEPLVSFAKDQRLRLVALNPPKQLVRSVARNGLAQTSQDPDWIRWGLDREAIIDDPAYRQKIIQQLRACHDGGSDKLYETMYEASMVRDEGMARTVVSLVESVRAAKDPLAGPVVSYTGGGHIQYNLPVPKRVARRLAQQVRQVSIYMTSFEQGRLQDLQEMVREQIADYVWLTPPGAQAPPQRCR